jgi:hypothetical protein
VTIGTPYIGSGLDLQPPGARLPAPLRVSCVIAGASSALLLFAVVTVPKPGMCGFVAAAALMLALWSGVFFDWLVARPVPRVRSVAARAPQLEPRPSRVPPAPTPLDRAA